MSEKPKDKKGGKPFDPKMIKILRINEYLWLFFAVVAVILCAYSIIIQDREQSIYFIVLTFMAGFFYALKRGQRKRFENRKDEDLNR